VSFLPIKNTINKELLGMCYKRQQDGTAVYFLLPEKKLLHHARKVQPGLPIETFDDLAAYIIESCKYTYTKITDQQRLLYFRSIAKKFPLFPNQQEEEYDLQAQSMADTYRQWKVLGQAEGFPIRNNTLQEAFREYESWLTRNAFLDSVNILWKAAELLEMGAFYTPLEVVVAGFTDFSPLQSRLLEMLVKANVPVSIYLPQVDTPIVSATCEFLNSIGFTVSSFVTEPVNASVSVISAASMEEELYGILHEIADHHSYTEAGIVLANPSYEETLLRVAKELNIPLNTRKMMPLSDTLLVQTLRQLLCEPAKMTKWEKVNDVSALSSLLFLSPVLYQKVKYHYLKHESILHKELGRLYEICVSERNQKEKRLSEHAESFLSFLSRLEVNDMPIVQYWKSVLDTLPVPHPSAENIAIQIRAFHSLQDIVSNLARETGQHEALDFVVTHASFLQYIWSLFENESLYIHRKNPAGIPIFSLRDVLLFEGKKLYVLGMNEGIFPSQYQPNGFFSAVQLHPLNGKYGILTPTFHENKQKGMYDQLPYIAKEIVFSYTVGTDKDNPKQPSKFIRGMTIKKHCSYLKRMSKPVAYGQYEYETKVAYFMGKGHQLDDVPAALLQMSYLIQRLRSLEERFQTPIAHPATVTALERYVSCPFKYAIDMLKIESPIEEMKEVSRLEKGTLLHACIHDMFASLKLIGKTYADIIASVPSHAEDILHDIFETHWPSFVSKHPEVTPLQLQQAKDELQQMLRRWWREELKNFQNEKLANTRVAAIEESITVTLDDTIEFMGKIDRIDADDEGFVIFDYKLGERTIKQERIEQARAIQLPLYMLGYEQKSGKKPYGGGYLPIAEPTKRGTNTFWNNTEDYDRFLLKGKRKTAKMIAPLRKGALIDALKLKQTILQIREDARYLFSVRPYEESECTYCKYQSICRMSKSAGEGGE
jgi:ATP-dependent helicase/nuclease subunit B